MKLLKKFSNSLFSPREIINSLQDKWGTTLLFFLVLMLLASFPYIVVISMKNDISYNDKANIREIFNGEEIPFSIQDRHLVTTKGTDYTYKKAIAENLDIVFSVGDIDNNSTSFTRMAFVFEEDGVYLRYTYSKLQLFTYSKYESLEDIDFSKASDSGNIDFWNTVFQVVKLEYQEMKTQIVVIFSLSYFLQNTSSYFFLSLMFAFFLFLFVGRKFNFNSLWKISFYLLTPYVMGILLSVLFNTVIFQYIGFTMSFIYAVKIGKTIMSVSNRGEQ